jgi:membrane protein
MTISWGMNLAIGIVRNFADTLFVRVPGYSLLWSLAPAGVSFALMALMFLLLYRFSPMCGVAWREVWLGAVIAALVWEMVRSGFAIYVTYFANYSSTYGSLGALMAFLFWLYLAHMIILFGAGLTYSMRLERNGLATRTSCALPEDAPTQQKSTA